MDGDFFVGTFPSKLLSVLKQMKPHLGIEPNVNVIQVSKEMIRSFNSSRGGSIEQSFLYFDGVSAASWCELTNQEEYAKAYGNQSFFSIAAENILTHLEDTKFDKNKIDIVGIGSGDGKKEAALIKCLLEINPDLKVHCHLIDKSYPLLSVSHDHFDTLFSHSDQVTFQQHHADFWKLPHMADIFDSERAENVLRVGCMLDGTIGNLENEVHFIRNSLQAFKAGDLFLTDIMTGFAPSDQKEKIYSLDPRFTAKGWSQGLETWLASTVNRYRNSKEKTEFKTVLSHTTSPIPNTYTLEIHALVGDGDKKARFNMLRLHRYDLESFIGAFIKEGWRRLGGKTFGYENKRLWYIFVKE